MFSGRVRQSKASSAAGFAVGLLFVGLGVFMVIPRIGLFGYVWTGMSAVIAAYHGYGLFSRRGVALYEMEGDVGKGQRSISDRLAELEEARRRGLITDGEYQQQRDKILSGA